MPQFLMPRIVPPELRMRAPVVRAILDFVSLKLQGVDGRHAHSLTSIRLPGRTCVCLACVLIGNHLRLTTAMSSYNISTATFEIISRCLRVEVLGFKGLVAWAVREGRIPKKILWRMIS
jgi:hypothetical protein